MKTGLPDEPLFRRQGDVAKQFGVTPSTLIRWRTTQGFPQPYRLGGRLIAYKIEEIEKWISSRPQQAGPPPSPQAFEAKKRKAAERRAQKHAPPPPPIIPSPQLPGGARVRLKRPEK